MQQKENAKQKQCYEEKCVKYNCQPLPEPQDWDPNTRAWNFQTVCQKKENIATARVVPFPFSFDLFHKRSCVGEQNDMLTNDESEMDCEIKSGD